MRYLFEILKKNIKSINSYFLFALLITSISITCFGVYLALYHTPDDYLQKELVKIMYVHVPCAWLSMMLYSLIALCSLLYLIKRIVIFDMIAKHTAIIALFSIIVTLTTGSIWGKPAWGTWWVWDARLTSMLILSFMVLSYIMIRKIYNDKEYSAKISAIISLVGFLNVPLIKFSVDIWSTLHQKSSFSITKLPSIHHTMIYPLIIIFFGITLLSFCDIMAKVRSELIAKKLARSQI